MQWLNGSYTQSFNRKHGRVGHVLQGRFKAPLIEKSSYFLELLRYVALNPVRGGLVTRPDEYPWSSHRALLGQVPPPAWLAVDRVLREFGPMRARARGEYERFVNAAIGIESTLWRNLVAQAYLGSDEWLDQVKRKVDEKLRSDDHPWQQRAVRIPTMAAVADVVGKTLNADLHRRGNTMPRSIAAWIASNEALLTNRQIAAGLRLRSAGHGHGTRPILRSRSQIKTGSSRMHRSLRLYST
jgi:hypothetical protein